MSLLTDFEIENFRCFDTFKMHNIKRINLIGGMNNAGKTALLEALFLSGTITKSSLNYIKYTLRGEKAINGNQLNITQWYSLFYHRHTKNFIKLKSTLSNKATKEVYARTFGYVNHDMMNQAKTDVLALKTIADTFEKGSKLYAAHYFNGESYDEPILTEINSSNVNDSALDILSIGFNWGGFLSESYANTILFIPAGIKINGKELAQMYDAAKFKGQAQKLLSALQLIEPTIVNVDMLNLGEPALYATRQNEQVPSPLSTYGDAITKIALYVLYIINNPNSIFLLDEVENGIHYTNQPKFWAWLFDLATEFDIQIFATTHSREMIEAYSQTAIEKGMAEEGGYYELYRSPTTNQVKNHQIAVDTIPFQLERNKPIRGEQE